MAIRKIYTDKTEIVVVVKGKNRYTAVNLTFDQIIRIQFDKYTAFKWFRKIPSEKITIVARKRENPIVFTKRESKGFFEAYKLELEQFARDNRITFFNNTD